MNSSRIIWRD